MRSKLMAAGGAVLCAALWSAAPASASTTWRVQAVPSPTNSAAQLQGVSCPTTGICIAVGYSADKTTFAEQTLAERWTGGQWSIQPAPSPGVGGVDQFTGVSCPSATDCTAVGIDSTSTATNSTLAEHWDGTSWTVEPSPDPAGTTVTDFVGVSCASPASCTATGLYDKTTGGSAHEVPLAEHWNGSGWTVQAAPLPAGAIAADLDGGVSCPSVTECTAVGSWTGPSQTGGPLVESWNGIKWQVQPTPALPAGAYNPFFAGVSCTSAMHCTAVGGYLNGNVEESLVERWDGTSWTIQADAAPAGTAMDSVSCTSSASCTAVGGGEAEHWDGTSWTLQPPMPIPHHATRGVAVPGVSCRSAVTCTAVGLYGRQAHPLAEHE